MIDHVSLGTHHFDSAIEFYAACFAPLGYTLQHRNEKEAAFGHPDALDFWLYPVARADALVASRSHVAVAAGSREQVQAFYERALAQGAESLVPPGERPDVSPAYYGAVLSDPDGHTIEAVYWERG